MNTEEEIENIRYILLDAVHVSGNLDETVSDVCKQLLKIQTKVRNMEQNLMR